VVGSDFHVVTARKGRQEYRIQASGRGAHAGSRHHEGINAVTLLSKVIAEVDALTDYSAELTVNVASVSGGTVLNRVPHEACADLEMRAYSPEQLDATSAAMRCIAAKHEVPGASIQVECVGKSPAWPEESRNRQLAALWQQAAGLMGRSVILTRRGGLSDANHLCHLGPTLDGLGPFGDNAHCSERSETKTPEWVAPSSFVPKAVLNALAICALAKGQ
jgi:glutamate carboxypeptidase